MEQATRAVNEKLQLDVIYTDFSKNQVNHDIISAKLNSLGITGQLLELLKSYLQSRHFVVKYN